MTPVEMVNEFHRHVGLPVASWPSLDVPTYVTHGRLALLEEEVGELRSALAADDIVGVADALGDILYVVYGTALTYGVPIDAVFAEIHRSNMTKSAPPSGSKALKGPGYEPPRLAPMCHVPSKEDLR